MEVALGGGGVRGQKKEPGAAVSVAGPGSSVPLLLNRESPPFSSLFSQIVDGACGQEIWSNVQEYYGPGLGGSAALQTSVCQAGPSPLPPVLLEALQAVHHDVRDRFYGCGLVCPEFLENRRILDLGSGSGQDCYVLSQLVGEKGHVTGVDMTKAQVEVAKKYVDYHMKKFGFQTPNVNFIHGYIEKLGEAGIKDESYDIIVSNCVINLVPNKRQVLQEAYRVLKPGGELYFSDVYASLDLPEEIRSHRVLWGECIGGALFWKDLFAIAQEIGFCPPRLVSAFPVAIQNKELEKVVGNYQFVSANFRLFKLLEKGPVDRCEVIYNGGITGFEKELVFDANFTFKEGEVVEVDEVTAAILQNSRFAESFLIRPVGEKLPTPGGCSRLEPKEIITDPFKLVEQLKTKPACSTASKACGGSKKCG
ncbi:arsenite methyltransferase [Tachyglossus aculeatus]|uniref:arsenite methyltransferase n=1 Tax=Tachyglossus aculeatus TaxID=9261 RepID=UPI0018F446DA|nr:arsenite methyltransferase [Tachyglossus aculeatus]